MKSLILTATVSLLLCASNSLGQLRPVIIEEEQEANRIHLFAVNQNNKDLDVSIEVSGTGIRQSGGRDRLFRVPAASRVNIKTLVVERGATPSYTYELTVKEELSKRVIKKPAERIKIDPPKNILVYTRKSCEPCAGLIKDLDSSYYKYRVIDLDEDSKIRQYVAFELEKGSVMLDSTTNPVISLGGEIRADISAYEELRKLLEQTDQE